METTIICPCCGRALPPEMFYQDDRHRKCKECHRTQQRLWSRNQFRIFARKPFDMGILLGLETDELLFIGEQKTREYWNAMADQTREAMLV